MFKRFLLLALCLIVASICYAQADDNAGKQQPDQPQVSDQPTTSDDTMQSDQNTQNKTINGTISDIDHKKMEITVKDDVDNAKTKYTFTTTTAFTRDGATITHDELKKGDHVMVEVDPQNAVMKVEVTPKESSKKDDKTDSKQPH
jgi:type III secretory pathway component EscV